MPQTTTTAGANARKEYPCQSVLNPKKWVVTQEPEEHANILAYMILDESNGIHAFETKYHGVGYGTEILQELQRELPDIWLAATEIESQQAERFWKRLKLLSA